DNTAAIVASTSDLLNLPAFYSAATHALELGPFGYEAHQQEARAFSAIGSAVARTGAVNAPAHLDVTPALTGNADTHAGPAPADVQPADALPLIAVLWDLAASEKSSVSKAVAHEAASAAVVPTAASSPAAAQASVVAQPPVLTVKMALDASHDLPAVQS